VRINRLQGMDIVRRLAQVGKKCKWPWVAMGLLFLLSACVDAPVTEVVELPPPPAIEDLMDFHQELIKAGADLGEAYLLEFPIFDVPERVFTLEGDPLVAYEFESGDERDEALSIVLDEGLAPTFPWTQNTSVTRIWSPGRLIVLYGGEDGGAILLLSGLMGDPVNLETPAQDEPYPPAISAVIQQVAEDRGIDPSRIQVLNYEAVRWEDACLGLPEPGEDCPERFVSGWEVHLRVGAEEVQVRVNSLGSEVREEK
jgi:hypothetical protein